MRNRDDIDIDWRWATEPITIGGLHPSILLGFPAIIFGSLSMTVIYAVMGWGAFLVYVLITSGQPSPWQWMRYVRARIVQRGYWPARHD